VWDLWEQVFACGQRESVIITSSRKDALCIWNQLGIPSLSLQGEGYLPKPQVLNRLKSRYNKVYVLLDNDYDKDPNPGQVFSRKFEELFDLPGIIIPSLYESKDPSDLYKNHGHDVLEKVIREQL
jgi:hypothetical protein